MSILPLETVNPLEVPSWNELILHQGNPTFFHTANWARVLHESYGYTPVFFTKLENSNITVLLPFMEVRSSLTGRRGVSLPFTDSCEPVPAEGTCEDPIVTTIAGYGKRAGWKYIETRGWPEIPAKPVSAIFYGHSLDLKKTDEAIFSSFRDNTRRNIKRALKAGVVATISTTDGSMEQFVRLNLITRKKHGLPPQPGRFFRKVSEHVIGRGLGIIVLASYRGAIVAGSLFFHFGGKAIFKYGASDPAYQDLRANNLVMWEGIRWYQRNGYQDLSFGRTEPQNEGLRQFKLGWGTRERTIPYYRYDLKENAFVRGEPKIQGLHNAVFRRMPGPLLKLTGKLLYRHMG